jgi:hypothetical protein
MSSQQVESFSRTHQTDTVRVVSTLGQFRGRVAGVRFDREQHRQCLRLAESPRSARSIPVHTIRALEEE